VDDVAQPRCGLHERAAVTGLVAPVDLHAARVGLGDDLLAGRRLERVRLVGLGHGQLRGHDHQRRDGQRRDQSASAPHGHLCHVHLSAVWVAGSCRCPVKRST